MNILLLEDEYSLRKSIKELLEDVGYLIDDYANGDDAYDAIFSKTYDLLILDVNVPGIKGFELLEKIRQDGIETPVIFTTSLTDIDDVTRAFGSGCCDYLKKPFDMAELRLRVENALKHNFKYIKKEIPLSSGYVYDTQCFALKKDGIILQLSKTEKMLIELFIKHKNQIVTPDMIVYYIWADEIVDPANVRVQVNNLRKKLDKDLIVNVRGLGYKLESSN
ncbi:response regulator transcription factor [Arcobacter sp. FWKO B]|uniref:response regulator transcription factor n=1 Tax=Arcobacter sp. FWKO B TaxID=2593672 RepID=UPI0018A342FA|nr:response regulator transcription factor [Arcobacter sp. FWKO B]QOG12491.1 response regulator transcription factor [Arcobacter sp. FWKO B]